MSKLHLVKMQTGRSHTETASDRSPTEIQTSRSFPNPKSAASANVTAGARLGNAKITERLIASQTFSATAPVRQLLESRPVVSSPHQDPGLRVEVIATSKNGSKTNSPSILPHKRISLETSANPLLGKTNSLQYLQLLKSVSFTKLLLPFGI